MKRISLSGAALALVMSLGLAACSDDDNNQPPINTDRQFIRTDLVSDQAGVALNTNADLINGWGVARGPNSAIWVNSNGAGLAQIFDGNGQAQSLLGVGPNIRVDVPPTLPVGTVATPTGLVFNSGTAFSITTTGTPRPAVFIGVTEEGTITGWSPDLTPNMMEVVVDNSASGAVYKGVAIAQRAGADVLYVTNFNAGTVEAFDNTFAPISLPFTDPTLPTGFAPFGISFQAGSVWVTYAMQDAAKHDDVAGAGLGRVDEFDVDGNLIRTFVDGGSLNAPWGILITPADYGGGISDDVLVANFGDGVINSYNRSDGSKAGALLDETGNTIVIDGLWGLVFGNGVSATDTRTIYFAAGPNGEANGLFGKLEPVF